MKKPKWLVYISWIVLVEAVGAFSGWLTSDGAELYAQVLKKPPLSPPGIVFPIVWSILFLLMGISAARIYLTEKSQIRSSGLLTFAAQLAVNFFWSIIFFNLMNFGFAFIWLLLLWGLILRMIQVFWRCDKAAALLQIPYLLWVTFAGYLNLGVWILNK